MKTRLSFSIFTFTLFISAMAFAAVDVALYVGGGARKADLVHWQKTLAGSKQITLKHLYAADIRTNENVFADVDLLVLPNGDADAQYAALKEVGRGRLVQYITGGGKVLATGAGCELLLTGKNRLGILPYQAKEGQSGRGRGYAKVDFTAEAQTAMGVAAEVRDIWFDNGPVLEKVGEGASVYGTIYSSVMENGSRKDGMYNTPSVIYATNATSKVLAMTFEPQHFTATRQGIAQGAIRLLTGDTTVSLPSYGLPSYTGSADKSELISKMATIGSTYTEPTEETTAGRLKVAYYCGKGGNGANNVLWAKTLNESPDVQLWIVNASDIAGGALTGKDVLVMPGGSSVDIYSGLGTDAQNAIRSYVQNGGKYYGTCAGTSLLLNASGRIAMIPYDRYSESISRGGGMVVCEFAEAGRALSPLSAVSMAYHKGPVMYEKAGEGLATMEVLAVCRSEVQELTESKNKMYGSPAILRGTYGSGKLFLTNCHPEAYAETRYVISAGFEDLTGRYIRIPSFGPYANYAGTSKEELEKAAE